MLYIRHEICRYRKDVVDMCTETDNEKLIEVLVNAAGAAFLSLKETTKEHFYFYAFILFQYIRSIRSLMVFIFIYTRIDAPSFTCKCHCGNITF